MTTEPHISHYGVKGMRWGVRRNERRTADVKAEIARIAARKALKSDKAKSSASTRRKIGIEAINAAREADVKNARTNIGRKRANRVADKLISELKNDPKARVHVSSFPRVRGWNSSLSAIDTSASRRRKAMLGVGLAAAQAGLSVAAGR